MAPPRAAEIGTESPNVNSMNGIPAAAPAAPPATTPIAPPNAPIITVPPAADATVAWILGSLAADVERIFVSTASSFAFVP